MGWHYEIESNEQFISSAVPFKNKDMASRHKGENSYSKYVGSQSLRIPFSISGKNDVTLTVHDTEFSYNGKYYCDVTVKSNNVKSQQEMCTNLFVYGMIFIGY
jgi:negative regulator of genetic competence, sporulation and motility